MPGKGEEDGLALAAAFAGFGLVDRGADRVISFRGRDDSLGERKDEPGLEGRALRHGDGLNQALTVKQRDQRGVAVVKQAVCLHPRRKDVSPWRVLQAK